MFDILCDLIDEINMGVCEVIDTVGDIGSDIIDFSGDHIGDFIELEEEIYEDGEVYVTDKVRLKENNIGKAISVGTKIASGNIAGALDDILK